MEFWGARVECGRPFEVKAGGDRCLHIKWACLGPVDKKTDDYVCLEVSVHGHKYVLALLSSNWLSQVKFDLVFDTDFVISHTSPNTCVCFFGFTIEKKHLLTAKEMKAKKEKTREKRQGERREAKGASSVTEELEKQVEDIKMH